MPDLISYGSNEGSEDEKPPHKVYLDAFYISRCPVTNAEYKKFVDATGRDVPFAKEDWAKPYNWDKKTRNYPNDKANHPVVLVSWYDAVEYCIWAGVRLPTEAEWEKAARGTDGRTYPWGNGWDQNLCNNRTSPYEDTVPVGSYPRGASPYGVMDMAGNAWEWTDDWYKSYPGAPTPLMKPGK
jgi:formylglycine-generating enzyme required for sulfatase activity